MDTPVLTTCLPPFSRSLSPPLSLRFAPAKPFPTLRPPLPPGNYGDLSYQSTITSPAVSKNCIAVGATLNYQDPYRSRTTVTVVQMTVSVALSGTKVGGYQGGRRWLRDRRVVLAPRPPCSVLTLVWCGCCAWGAGAVWRMVMSAVVLQRSEELCVGSGTMVG